MSRSTAWYLLCYDIRDEERLVQVHKIMCRWGQPLQYSVFRAQLTRWQCKQMMEELRDAVDERVDDVRLYRIDTHAELRRFGYSPVCPDGDILFEPYPKR